MTYPKYCLTPNCGNPAEPRSYRCLVCQLAGEGTMHEDKPRLTTPTVLPPYLGRAISVALGSADLWQSEVAERLGIDSSIVSLWVRDKRPVPWNRIEDLADALETTAEQLLGDAAQRMPVVVRASSLPDETEHATDEVDELFEAMLDRPREPVPPSARSELLWCDSGHGSGVPRRHHHGWAPAYALRVARIDVA